MRINSAEFKIHIIITFKLYGKNPWKQITFHIIERTSTLMSITWEIEKIFTILSSIGWCTFLLIPLNSLFWLWISSPREAFWWRAGKRLSWHIPNNLRQDRYFSCLFKILQLLPISFKKKNKEVTLASTQGIFELFDFDLQVHSTAARRKIRILSVSPVWVD